MYHGLSLRGVACIWDAQVRGLSEALVLDEVCALVTLYTREYTTHLTHLVFT